MSQIESVLVIEEKEESSSKIVSVLQASSLAVPVCNACHQELSQEIDSNAPQLHEWICLNRLEESADELCPNVGHVVKTMIVKTETGVEQFGRAPTNPGLFGKNLGGTAPKQVIHMIVQRNKNVIARTKDRIIEGPERFRMDTRQGRIANVRERRKLQQASQPVEDVNIHHALEIISKHFQKANLSAEKLAMFSQSIRPVVSIKTIGRQPPRLIREMINCGLEYAGLPLLEENVSR